ncbi:MAG: B12-binding domain-containing radical SAM protein [Phycisphaeraceae bacterium]
MRILFVQPDWRQNGFGFRLVAMPEPLGLEMLAASVPDHDVRIADLRCGDELAAEIADFQPDLVGVTALTPEVYAAAAVLEQTKALAPEAFTLVGGHHASLLPEDFHLPQVDAIIRGEGEPVLPRLVAALEAGRDLAEVPNLVYQDRAGRFVATGRRTEALDVDALPLPRRDLTARHREKYFFLFDQPDTSMATGRGCPWRCNFCSVWEFYDGRTRMMSPARVIRELETVETDHVTFVDDNFMLNHRRENEIADRIRAAGIQHRYSMECRTDSIVRHPELVEKWVDIGLYAVLLGLEGADDTLESVGKRNTARVNDQAIDILQDLGVVIWGAFIVDPRWEADDFKRLRDYVAHRGITHTQFTVLTPLPGTQLHRDRQQELITRDYTCFDALHAVTDTRLDRETFYRHFAELYRQTSLQPYFDAVRDGRLTIDDIRRGKAMLDAMSRPENYAVNDPVLREAALA